MLLLNDELIDVPVLVRVVREVPSNNHGDLSLTQFLHRDLQGIGLTGNVDHNGSIHTNLESTGTQDSGTLVFSHVASCDSL